MGTTSTKAPAKKSTSAKAQKATALLRADHKAVSSVVDQFETTRSTTKKKSLVAQICAELTVHAQVEEEIFYPAVKAALKDKELVPEATVEHATLKDLVAQVEGVEPAGEMFDAKIQVMSEYVKHHVQKEQNDMFPKAKATRLDMMALVRRPHQLRPMAIKTRARQLSTLARQPATPSPAVRAAQSRARRRQRSGSKAFYGLRHSTLAIARKHD
jgi:hemerythrin superfamily protein